MKNEEKTIFLVGPHFAKSVVFYQIGEKLREKVGLRWEITRFPLPTFNVGFFAFFQA